jgi:hypothetical protein
MNFFYRYMINNDATRFITHATKSNVEPIITNREPMATLARTPPLVVEPDEAALPLD